MRLSVLSLVIWLATCLGVLYPEDAGREREGDEGGREEHF